MQDIFFPRYSYTVNYYYDGVKDTSATVTGTAAAGTEIRYSTVPKDGYKWEKVMVDGTNTTEKAFVKAVTDGNVVRVYFVTAVAPEPVPDTSQNDSVPQTMAAPVLPKTGDTTGLFGYSVGWMVEKDSM